MLQVGDCVVSSSKGICLIKEETWENFSGAKKLYFVLIPLQEKDSKIFIPVENAEQKMRKVMTEEEAKEFISKIPLVPELEIENERMREKEYKDAVYSGNPVTIVQVIKSIYVRRQDRLSSGKKVTAVDDRYFKMAIHALHSELAYAIGAKEEDMEDIIISALGKNTCINKVFATEQNEN